MNCREAETLILAERDGVLTPVQHAALERHVAGCEKCRQWQHEVAQAMETVRADMANVRVPDVETEWRAVQAKIGAPDTMSKKRRLAPVIWMTAPLAAAAAVALAFLVTRPVAPQSESTGLVSAQVQADFVDVADPNATAVVYTDEESGWLVVWAVSDPKPAHG